MDAGAIVLALGAITYFAVQATRFVRQVDSKTLEAADFAVLVRNVPRDVDVREIGAHFARFGRVMDVVVVRDMVRACIACKHRGARACMGNAWARQEQQPSRRACTGVPFILGP